MNLLEDAWIPVKRKSGRTDRIAPWQITESDDSVFSVYAVRPDFSGAILQFLVGLVQTALPPDDYDQWVNWLEGPPPPELLQEKFSRFLQAFNLDGEGPKFMQDYDELDAGVTNSISSLLIETPGEKTIKENKDHFIKRGHVQAVCPACAATALFTLQTNAPSGGQGHRTSLRGGGPLTTLVVLDPEGSELESSLWRNVWLNILEKEAVRSMTGDFSRQNLADIFPWLAPTRTSEKTTGQETRPSDAHPLQMYWGMPRRIRLSWDSLKLGYCEVCNIRSEKLVTRYKTQNLGINYTGAWQHPLSPHFVNKDGGLIPMHAQPGGLTYRYWLGMVAENESVIPALVARRFYKLAQKYGEQFRLHVFGYDMDNMKARCWYETTFPLYLIPDAIRENFSIRVQALTESADLAAKSVRACIKEAWFKRPGDHKGDTSFLAQAFFQHTELFFYQAVQQLLQKIPEKSEVGILQEWHGVLCRTGLKLFDYWAEQGNLSEADPRRSAVARQKLANNLNNKKICELLHSSKKKGRKA